MPRSEAERFQFLGGRLIAEKNDDILHTVGEFLRDLVEGALNQAAKAGTSHTTTVPSC